MNIEDVIGSTYLTLGAQPGADGNNDGAGHVYDSAIGVGGVEWSADPAHYHMWGARTTLHGLSGIGNFLDFFSPMRDTPEVLFYSTNSGDRGKAYCHQESGDVNIHWIEGIGHKGISVIANNTSDAGDSIVYYWTADAEI